MSRFVRPQTTVLALTHGDSITIKTRLSSGEQREAFARMYLAGVDGRLHANPLQTGLAIMCAYLIDWNLTDDDGALVAIRGLSLQELESVINTLDPDSFQEIKQAIEAHEEQQRASRVEEKKTPSGQPSDDQTSRSLSDVAGTLIGSVN